MNYSGTVLSGKNVSMTIYSGDYALSTTVRNNAKLRISSGGYVESTTVHASTTVSNAGVAVETYLSGGTMLLLTGGTASVVKVLRNARLTVSSGAVVADIFVSSGNVNTTVRGGDSATLIYGTNEAGEFGMANGVASNFFLNSLGQLTVQSGGTALDTTVCRGGTLTVQSDGCAVGVKQSAGAHIRADVYGGDAQTKVEGTNVSGAFGLSNGVASNFILYDGGIQQVSSGGIALHTLVSGQQAFQFVWSGGVASATSVFRNGGIRAYESGILRDAWIGSGGSMLVYGGAIVSGALVSGTMEIDSGNTGDDESAGLATLAEVTVMAGGKLNFKNGANVSGPVEVDGTLLVGSDATVSGVTVRSGGSAQIAGVLTVTTSAWNVSIASGGQVFISSGGRITGTLNIADGGAISADAGGIVDFDISGAAPGDPAPIANLSAIQGEPDFTVTVAMDQADGVYSLAGGATGFAPTVTVTTDAGATLGEITVGGEIINSGCSYRLALAEDLLQLAVSLVPTKTPGDLDANARADIIMSITEEGHGAYGATGAWLIERDQTTLWDDLSTREAGWEIFGTGYSTTDKLTADVYIKSTGNVVGAWVTDESGKVAGWTTVGEFDAETQVLGLGDFNGDGQTDLLLRNTNGAVGCYFTSGETTGWNYFQSLGDEWTVSAIGDLNGDGRDDVVLKHDAGFAGSWLTQSDGTVAWANLDTLDNGFAIVGCGDFNADGTSDVLLRNGSYYGAWIVENGSVSAWMGFGDLSGLTVEEIADFDGDGIDDLRVRTAGGDLGAQLVKGADTLEWKYYGSVGNEWSTALASI